MKFISLCKKIQLILNLTLISKINLVIINLSLRQTKLGHWSTDDIMHKIQSTFYSISSACKI